MEHSREGGKDGSIGGIQAAVLGAFPGTHHCCIAVGGSGLLVELGTVLENTEMLAHKLGVQWTDTSQAVSAGQLAVEQEIQGQQLLVADIEVLKKTETGSISLLPSQLLVEYINKMVSEQGLTIMATKDVFQNRYQYQAVI